MNEKSPRAVYSQVILDPEIKLFVVKFLNPKVTFSGRSPERWAGLKKHAKKLDWPLVHDLIRRLDYDNYFMDTLYWRIVADEVKRRDDYECQRCGRPGIVSALEAHHKTYENHGSEHLHLEDLETLCGVCHRIEHAQIVEAIIAEWECVEDEPFRQCHLNLEGFNVRPPSSDQDDKASADAP